MKQKQNSKPTYNEELPDCIICDLDGTLAHRAEGADGTYRGPYEYDKVIYDEVDEVVSDILTCYSVSIDIIIVTGRSDNCRDVTKKWLKENEIEYHDLLMRKSKDNREDSIVKKELYEEHIRDKYNVLFVMDDRDSVVKMWRGEGLKCLQVADGNF